MKKADEKEIKEMLDKVYEVKEKIGDVLQDSDLSLGAIMPLMIAMTIDVARQAGFDRLKLIYKFAEACVVLSESSEEDEADEEEEVEHAMSEKGKKEWLN